MVTQLLLAKVPPPSKTTYLHSKKKKYCIMKNEEPTHRVESVQQESTLKHLLLSQPSVMKTERYLFSNCRSLMNQQVL